MSAVRPAAVTTACTRCQRPARGTVATQGDVPAHYCRQCVDHCEIARYVAVGRALPGRTYIGVAVGLVLSAPFWVVLALLVTR